MKTYYFGIYRDKDYGCKVAQLALKIDGLSSNLLSSPGTLTIMAAFDEEAEAEARRIASEEDCFVLEIYTGTPRTVLV